MDKNAERKKNKNKSAFFLRRQIPCMVLRHHFIKKVTEHVDASYNSTMWRVVENLEDDHAEEIYGYDDIMSLFDDLYVWGQLSKVEVRQLNEYLRYL